MLVKAVKIDKLNVIVVSISVYKHNSFQSNETIFNDF